MKIALVLSVGILALGKPASAAETISYAYDAQGRLTTVTHSGTVNNGVQATYQFDAADNRIAMTIVGASSKVVVVPINGLTVIPISEP